MTVLAGSSGPLAIVGEAGLGSPILTGPLELNNALTLAALGTTDLGLFGVISGSGALNIGNTGSFVVFGATKNLTNTGSVTLWRNNTYTGNTNVNSGTLKLGAQASIANSPVIALAAGTTLDVSQIAAYTLSSTNTLSAKGTGTTTGTFTYTRRATPTASGITYTVLTSTMLAGWTPDGSATQAVTGTASEVETVLVTLSGVKPLTDTKLFVRVEALSP